MTPPGSPTAKSANGMSLHVGDDGNESDASSVGDLCFLDGDMDDELSIGRTAIEELRQTSQGTLDVEREELVEEDVLHEGSNKHRYATADVLMRQG